MLNNIKRIIKSLIVAKNYYKHGGYTQASISYVNNRNALLGKRLLITGGTSGIGYAIAKKALDSGAEVVITGRNQAKLEKALSDLNNDKCKGIVWDILDISIINSKIDHCKTLLDGKIDVLINNAGIAPSKFWGNVDEEEWDKIYSTNLKGMYFLTQELVKQWNNYNHSDYKKIINISSQGGFVGATYPYRMVKWDIRGLTEGLAKELISQKIIVNGIAPGVVKTSMQQFSLEQGDNLFTIQNPIRRVCLPEEIAELAVFLIGDSSNFIIGQTIICDGGYTLK